MLHSKLPPKSTIHKGQKSQSTRWIECRKERTGEKRIKCARAAIWIRFWGLFCFSPHLNLPKTKTTQRARNLILPAQKKRIRCSLVLPRLLEWPWLSLRVPSWREWVSVSPEQELQFRRRRTLPYSGLVTENLMPLALRLQHSPVREGKERRHKKSANIIEIGGTGSHLGVPLWYSLRC